MKTLSRLFCVFQIAFLKKKKKKAIVFPACLGKLVKVIIFCRKNFKKIIKSYFPLHE